MAVPRPYGTTLQLLGCADYDHNILPEIMMQETSVQYLHLYLIVAYLFSHGITTSILQSMYLFVYLAARIRARPLEQGTNVTPLGVIANTQRPNVSRAGKITRTVASAACAYATASTTSSTSTIIEKLSDGIFQ